jgi:glycosyltransferase involved in cell wall biosynthesis
MRVGIHIAGSATPMAGGEYTFVTNLLAALARAQKNSSHELVLCCSGAATDLNRKFPSFETIDVNQIPQGERWEASMAGLLHWHGIQFNLLMQHWAMTTLDIPYATHLWDIQHRNNPWFPEVSHGGAWEKREELLSRVLRRAAIIIVGSDTSREEVSRYYQVLKERVCILPFPPADFALDRRLIKSVARERCISNDFLFYPAQFWAHKNHVLLLEACRQVRDRLDWNLDLVFVGSDKGNETYLRDYADRIGISTAVHFLGHVKQEKLIQLYRQAFCLAFPSLCGPENLPPLEAFGLGCPVLASDIPGAREQFGDAALLFDPKSVTDFVDRLIELKGADARKSLIAAGHKRATRYTWDHYARDFLTILDDFWPLRRCWKSEVPSAVPPEFPSALTLLVAADLRVAVDLRHLTREASGGVTPLIVETLKALHELCPEWRFDFFCTMFSRDLLDIVDPRVKYHCLPLDDYYDSMGRILAAEGIEVLLRCFPADDDLDFPLDQQIILIPDLQHEFFPDFFSKAILENRRRNFPRLITQCGAVATISAHAETTIRQRYNNRFDDIFVMTPSSQVLGAAKEEVSANFRERVLNLKPYFYFPANLWPHKNHAKLLEAFTIFRADDAFPAHNLILTGHQDRKHWKRLSQMYSTQNVHHFGFISKAELDFLYREAAALTFVSLFEGFGMPVLEAFGVGCPVICSNGTSLPEVSEGAALICDPVDANNIAEAMRRIVTEPRLARELVKKGRQRFAAFSWTSTAEQLKQAFIRVAGRHSTKTQSVKLASRPVVSIVTPSYNQGHFLRRTIESVLNQTYPSIEYIVIDGGSTDESLDILKSYGSRVRWVSEPDAGQTNAINKGFAECSGEIRAYLNSDDTLERNAAEKVVQFFEGRPEIGLVYGSANYIDTQDRIVGKYATAQYSFDRLVHDCCICQPAAFWRASVAERVGNFDESLNFAMDYEYWLRIGKTDLGIEFFPQILANSRLHAENKTLSEREKIYKEIFAISLKHAGRIDRNYIQGYWHHRLGENNDILARFGRRIPKFNEIIVDYDSIRYERPGKTHAEAAWGLIRLAGSRLRAGARAEGSPPRVAKELNGVSGVYRDNWLAPRVKLRRTSARRRPLVLAGEAATNCTLRIKSGKRLILQQAMVASQTTRIEFPDLGKPINLEFDHFIEMNGRKLAFLVQHTNCFSEEEI